MAILAAALYGISSPVSKILLEEIPPAMMASLLYLGAGSGMLLVNLFRRSGSDVQKESGLTRNELPYIIAMILLDIAAPLLLMVALTVTTAANASLLNNFEIVATSLIAMLIFKEAIGKRMWIAIALITTASLLLTINESGSLSFSFGSIFVILACACWGLENNCTRKLSSKNPLQIVVIKGFGSGLCSLAIAFAVRQFSSNVFYICLAFLLGFVAYGLSIYFYIFAQRELGAARTSAYYAVAPFIGVLISIIVFRQKMNASFVAALLIMIAGAYFAASERHQHDHVHHPVTHEHRHNHHDSHHDHHHDNDQILGDFLGQDPAPAGDHSHIHTHENIRHVHLHTPDIHHDHSHKDSD